MIQPNDFDPSKPFTVYEQPHQGKMRKWKCNNERDFINRCAEFYQHNCSWQELTDEERTNWSDVRRYIASDMQWCVLINDDHDE